MRVDMYVLNDVTRDARVLREAATLAAAGHRVTVLGATRTPDEPDGSREDRDGFTIIRVAIPGRSAWLPGFLRAPWRTIRTALGGTWRSVRAGNGGWLGLVGVGLGAALTLPWTLLRAAWYVAVNRRTGRLITLGGLDYVLRWWLETVGWARAAMTHAPTADVHHAHDMEALPAAWRAARRDRARVVYDSHEIFTSWGGIRRQPRWLRWWMARSERRMASAAAALVTVNRGLADVLGAALSPKRVVVVHNCPPRWDPPAEPAEHLRRAAGIAAGVPVVLCHGAFLPGRGLEQTAEAMTRPGLERAHLAFLGYRLGIVGPILDDPRLAGRVHYLPPVAPSEVTAWIADADVGSMPIAALSENDRLSTPNKLFECLAAGVPVVSSDLPLRRSIVIDDPDGPLGEVCDPSDPGDVARAIRAILELSADRRADLRRRCLAAAHARWNWETESAKLVDLYRDLEREPVVVG